jgi:hydrogenase expression/formation protein HypE
VSAPVPAEGLCPAPASRYDAIVMAHGGGGRMGADLLRRLFLPAFDNPVLSALEDQAVLNVGGARLAFTTDSFVVRPVFFPGGNIGTLAVNGTVNDLAVGGAKPLFLAAAFILEEGFPVDDLRSIVESMALACREAGVALVTGDTKVVDRGKGDKIFITTTGLGVVPEGVSLSAANARPGDKVLVSGTMGDHGMAIMSVREGLEFESAIVSDTAPLAGLAAEILRACPETRCMRDPTRGGLAATLNELAGASNVGIRIEESSVPVRPAVRGACEILGLDPLYVANEGKLAAVVPANGAPAALAAMRSHPLGRDAAVIGEIVADHPDAVTVRSPAGGERILTVPAGEQLPRIC